MFCFFRIGITLLIFFTFIGDIHSKEIPVKIKIAAGVDGGKYSLFVDIICEGLLRDGVAQDCEKVPTEGSVENLILLKEGKVDFILSQDDASYLMYNGEGEFFLKGNSLIRKVLSIYKGSFNFVVKKNTKFNSVYDILGHKLEIFGINSGSLLSIKLYSKVIGYDKNSFKDFIITKSLDNSFQRLCKGDTNAVFMISGHVSPILKKYFDNCDLKFLEIIYDEKVNKFLELFPYYTKVNIPSGFYKNISKPISSIGVPTSIITTSKIEEELVYKVLESIYLSIDYSKLTHKDVLIDYSELENIDEDIKTQKDFPYHEGAIKFFKKKGVI